MKLTTLLRHNWRRTVLLLPALSLLLHAEIAAVQTYEITFTDKKSSDYRLDRPLEFLTERSLQRRANQGIALDESDLPVNPTYIGAVANRGFTIVAVLKWSNCVLVETNNDFRSVDELRGLPFVKRVKDLTSKANARATRRDSKFDLETFTPNTMNEPAPEPTQGDKYNYGNAKNQVTMLKGNAVHNKGFDGKGVLISVIDAGFQGANAMFKNLWGSNRILGRIDYVNRTDTNEIWTSASSSHGTNVLSCIGAEESGKVVGTAPAATFWLMRTENAASETLQEEYYWAQAAESSDSLGVDVINSSLGYNEFDDKSTSHVFKNDMNGHTTVAANAADKAVQKGILCAISAGNDGSAAWKFISTPADADSVVTVGAVDANGTIAAFSSYGPSADNDVKPNVVAQGSGVYVLNPGNQSGTTQGTSFSSPITAGMLACMRQATPNAKVMAIVEAVQTFADKFSKPDARYGYGLPNYEKSLAKLQETSLKPSSSLNASNILSPYSVRNGIGSVQISALPTAAPIRSIAIYSMAGKQLRTVENKAGLTTLSLDLSGITAGACIVAITSTGVTYRQMIAIM